MKVNEGEREDTDNVTELIDSLHKVSMDDEYKCQPKNKRPQMGDVERALKDLNIDCPATEPEC